MRRASGIRGTERAVVMGLDMYLNGERYFMDRPPRESGKSVVKAEIYELGYWRKHPNLHGYIVQTFADGVDECQEISLDEGRLLQIMDAVKAKELPHTIGFFFGVSDDSEEEIEQDIEILKSALEWLRVKEKGIWRTVSYRASW
jgi:hypothetical protein